MQLIFSGLLFLNLAQICDPNSYQDCPPNEKLLAIIRKGKLANRQKYSRIKNIDKSQKDVLSTFRETTIYQSQRQI